MSKHEFVIRGYYGHEGRLDPVYVQVLIPNPPPGRKGLAYVCAGVVEPGAYKGDDEIRLNNATISTCVLEDEDAHKALTPINPKSVALRLHIAIGVAIERHLLAEVMSRSAR